MNSTRVTIGAVCAALAAVALLHHPMLGSGLTVLPGDVGDTRFNELILEHGFRWLTGRASSLWNVPMFYPAENTLAYSDAMLGIGLPYFAARAFGAEPDTALSLWFLGTTALNAAVFFLFSVRAAKLSLVAGFVAAVFFAAASSKANQLNHLQLLPMYFPVLVLWGGMRLVEGTSLRTGRAWFGVALLALVVQLWGGFYVGWFTVLLGTMGVAVALSLKTARPVLVAAVRRNVPVIVGGALVAGALLAPLGIHYMRAAKELGVRQWPEILLPRFQTWFNVGDANWLWSFAHSLHTFQVLPVEGEQRFGLGVFTTIATLYVAIRHRREPWVRTCALITVGVLALATMWRFGFSPWRAIYAAFPGGSAIRAVPRIGAFLLFPAALALGLLVQRRPEGVKGHAVIAVGLLCLLEQGTSFAHYDAATARANVARIEAAIPTTCAAVFVFPTDSRPDFEQHLDAAWAGMNRGVPTVNGYSGNHPKGWPFEKLAGRSRAELEAALTAWTDKPVCIVDAPSTPN